jgi:SAM-dependent methyltransferase
VWDHTLILKKNDEMKPEISQLLLDINRQFYEDFGDAFAATRQRIQPGIRRILSTVPINGSWLDLGCGSGALAAEWVRLGLKGSYWGLDSSLTLLQEARKFEMGGSTDMGQIRFSQSDLAHLDFPPLKTGDEIPQQFSGIFCFAVLHHLPSAELRRSILRRVCQLLHPGGFFIHSVWQFKHSPRLTARVQSFEQIGISPNDVDEGDTLLDWRYVLPNQVQKNGLRYVHHFSRSELAELAADSGFSISQEFESDGQGGRLGLYQVWKILM